MKVKEAATEFLRNRQVAVTGVSRDPKGHGSNVVYQRLKARGYEVFAVNPNAAEVEGDPSYPDLASIPGGVDAVVIATRAELAGETMRQCVDLGIRHVWMHRSFGAGSVSEEAAAFGRERGINVIDGGCPLMFEPTSDAGHKVMRFVLTLTGRVPRHCPYAGEPAVAAPVEERASEGARRR
jgi:predicted CoA-binding protein